MRKSIIVVSFFSVFFLAFTSVPTQAGFYIGVQAGVSNENVSFKDAIQGKLDFNKDSALLYGGQVGFKLASFAVQAEFYRANHGSLLNNFISIDSYQMEYYYLGVNAKLGIPLVLFYPYVTAGFGRYSSDIKTFYSGSGKNSDTSFNIGAGAELNLGKLGVFAEVRYIDFSMDIINLNWDLGGINLHFGLNYHF